MSDFVATDTDGDFGYDFSPDEELLLIQIASGNTTQHPRASPIPKHGFTSAVIDAVPGKTDSSATLKLLQLNYQTTSHESHGHQTAGTSLPGLPAATNGPRPPALPSPVSINTGDIYQNLGNALPGADTHQQPLDPAPVGENEAIDDRSPLKRFRSYPRKPLTVSDLTSGAWCELQYWYTLTRLPGGRRTRTPAMRQGFKVHQKLEDEVHTTVKVDVTSKEDAFGLRLWNLVQGLRTLRETGLTRELEVWGMIDGNLVNGIIDSLSHDNPNPEFEAELSSQGSQHDPRQSTLANFWPSQRPPKSQAKPDPKIYLADVKTRGSLARVSTAQLRPAKIQLLLYHRFLSDMAAGRLDFLKVIRRYGLDADDTFSDAYIAQIGALHEEMFIDAPASQEASASVTSTAAATAQQLEEPTNDEGWEVVEPESNLLKYRTLRELLTLVHEELELTFPAGEHSLGNMLRVLYVHREDGRDLDKHDFPVSREVLDIYLTKYMAWWQGQRRAEGVEIEEAFKCRTCEFASDCTWRVEMDQDRVRKAQQRMEKRAERT